MAGGDSEFLQAAAIFLGSAVVAVPLFKRLKLGSVLGYLAAGVLIGPQALALIPSAGDALAVAEFGVVLLLFVIGLELKPDRLWRLRMEIFGLGAAQMVVTGVAVGVVAYLTALWGFGLTWREAIVAGGGLALSSTALAIQTMRERGELATPYGDRAFAILLFQDLAIVPLIAIVAIIAPASEVASAPVWLQILQALAAIAAVYFIGRYGLRPLFHLIALTKADEVFTAAALLIVIGAALAMDAVGLSMAMGAFLAGVLLADSEFRHQLETDIEPFRGLLMGLFFMSVGMNLNLIVLQEMFGWVLLGVVMLVALKAAILYALAIGTGSRTGDALKIAALLSQGGEFGFVLFSEALSTGVMGAANASLLNATVILSMAATPIAFYAAIAYAQRAGARTDQDASGLQTVDAMPEHDQGKERVIIAGFGRQGQVVARILRLRGYETVMIDNSPRRIRMAQTFGNEVFFGDARRLDTLATAGAETAKAIVLSISDRDGAREAVQRIRTRFPNTRVYATTYDRFSQIAMERAGAHFVQRETLESSVALASKLLEDLGDENVVEEVIDEFRRRDAQLARLQAEYGAVEGAKQMREDFSLEKER